MSRKPQSSSTILKRFWMLHSRSRQIKIYSNFELIHNLVSTYTAVRSLCIQRIEDLAAISSTIMLHLTGKGKSQAAKVAYSLGVGAGDMVLPLSDGNAVSLWG
jgi:hypothetical protein